MMNTLYQGCKTIILYLIIMLVIQTAFGDKIAQKSSVMILFSILILQSDAITKYLSTITNDLTTNKKTLNSMTDGQAQAQQNNAGQSSTHTSASGVTHGGGTKSF